MSNFDNSATWFVYGIHIDLRFYTPIVFKNIHWTVYIFDGLIRYKSNNCDYCFFAELANFLLTLIHNDCIIIYNRYIKLHNVELL